MPRRAALCFYSGEKFRLALGLFVLGLLSKTVVATLPGALLVIFWWRHGRLSWQRDCVPLIPWFALGAAAGLLTAWVERRFIGAEGMAFDFTFLQRALLAGRVIWFYLSKLFWPVDLMFIYPRWEVNPALWWHYLFPLGSLTLVGWLWIIRRRWRGPLAAMLFFIGSLFPALGFFNVYPFVFSFVADHFQYLASLGIIVVVSAGIAVALAHLPQRARWAGKAFCILLLGGLAALTWQQSRTYGDPTILYQATLAKNPDCWMCRNNLGILLRLQGKLSESQKAFEAAVRIKPDYAEAHHNLGNALLQAGQVSEAIGHYQQALKINPDYAEAHYNLGNALLQAGQVSEAIGHYENVLKSNPEHPDVYNNIGGALLMMGRLTEAKKAFEAALRIRPDFAPALENLSLLRAQEQKVEFKK
jgi:tetratricopeptide (TPR) repeat protein